MSKFDAWQRDDGFPRDDYFEAVSVAFEEAGIEVEYWARNEDWDAAFILEESTYAGGPMGGTRTAHGLVVAWVTSEEDEPTHADDFSGDGWCYVTYSKPQALGDHVGELGLPYLAEPRDVAAAVSALIGRSTTADASPKERTAVEG